MLPWNTLERARLYDLACRENGSPPLAEAELMRLADFAAWQDRRGAMVPISFTGQCTPGNPFLTGLGAGLARSAE